MLVAMVTMLFASALLGFPLFLSIGLPIMVQYWNVGPRAFMIFVQQTSMSTSNYALIAVPMFILAGSIMNKVGITQKLVEFAYVFVGPFKGGLAQVNILASILFAGISGSALADSAAIGNVLIPAMEKQGYEKGFAGAVTAASANIGPIIPPSIVMVIYGGTFDVSVGALFAAGFIPGLTMGVSQMVITYIYSIRRNYPSEKRVSLLEAWHSFRKAIIALIMPIIIIGGIFSGQFTPTEAATIAVVYGLVIGFLVYRNLTIVDLNHLTINAALTSAAILFIIAMAKNFTWVISRHQIPQQIISSLFVLTENRIVILLMINLVLIVVGMFADRTTNLFLVGPFTVPILIGLGLSPVHAAMILILGLGIGNLTPPIGPVLFSTAIAGKMRVEDILAFSGPYIVGLVVLSLVTTFWPAFTEVFPRLLGFM